MGLHSSQILQQPRNSGPSEPEVVFKLVGVRKCFLIQRVCPSNIVLTNSTTTRVKTFLSLLGFFLVCFGFSSAACIPEAAERKAQLVWQYSESQLEQQEQQLLYDPNSLILLCLQILLPLSSIIVPDDLLLVEVKGGADNNDDRKKVPGPGHFFSAC
jgi:hypothetical protein